RLDGAERPNGEQDEKNVPLHEDASNYDRRCGSASRSRCPGRGRRIPEYLMATLADLVDFVARLEQRLRILFIDRGQGRLHGVLERSRELVPPAGTLVDQRANLVGRQLDARRQGPGA